MEKDHFRLFHQPTKTLFRLGGGRRSSYGWMTRSEHNLSLPTSNEGYASFSRGLLGQENLDPAEWRLIGVSQNLIASKRVPFEIPGFQMKRSVPKTMEALQERLDAVRIEEASSVDAYLWDVFRCWSHDLLTTGHPEVKLCYAWIREKLDVLGLEDVPDLVRVGQRLSRRYWSGAASSVRESIDRLAGPEHKALILATHDVNFNLLKIIRRFGWEEEVLAFMLEKSKYRKPSPSWDAFFLAERPMDHELVLEIATLRQREDSTDNR